jgi:hypothetical protein
MRGVVIGMDPHKRSATIEVVDEHEEVLASGRFPTDREGYRALLAAGRRHRHRLWAVEGSEGAGRIALSAAESDLPISTSIDRCGRGAGRLLAVCPDRKPRTTCANLGCAS